MLQQNARLGFITLIVLAMITRLIPHAPNFTAVGAAAIFGGFAFAKGYRAFLVPLIALFLSDLAINNIVYGAYYDTFQWYTPGFGYMYGAFLLSVLLGRLQRGSFKIVGLISTGVVSTLLFFFITNFGSWLSIPAYPKTAAGLLMACEAGLPFLLNQLGGTLLYGAVLFGAAYFFLGLREKQIVRA